MANYKQHLKEITTFIFDVDGVLTNGIVILSPDGDLLRTMNVKDGYAIKKATEQGFRIAIITGGRSELVVKRFKDLGVEDVFIGVGNKLDVYNNYIKQHKLSAKEILYMGDDIPDWEVMSKVGVSTCPSDAAEEIKAKSQYISGFKGGEGCVRDIIEQVMKVQDKWFGKDAFIW